MFAQLDQALDRPAGDFTGEPVARVHLPVRVPLGFHGSWLPDL
ncbi:carotenoid oxygenase family protein [Streptosporangium sp. NBC_01469]